MFGLFFYAEAVALVVEFCHPIAFGIVNVIAENRCLTIVRSLYTLSKHTRKSSSIEDVVAKYEANRVVTNELLADDERLRQSVGAGLFGVFKPYAQVFSITQQAFETRKVVWSGYNQYLSDAC